MHVREIPKEGEDYQKGLAEKSPRTHTWLETVTFLEVSVGNFIIHGVYCRILRSGKK